MERKDKEKRREGVEGGGEFETIVNSYSGFTFSKRRRSESDLNLISTLKKSNVGQRWRCGPLNPPLGTKLERRIGRRGGKGRR